MRLKSQVHISAVGMIDVVLVKDIIETLIEVFQVEENNCASSLHADLDLVDVLAYLQYISMFCYNGQTYKEK